MNPSPEPDIDGAIDLLAHSEDPHIRQVVAYLLGQAGDPRALEPLIDALQDAHVGVRGAAANALGTIGDRSAVPYLRPLAAADNPQLAVWAAFALTRLGEDCFDQIVLALDSADVALRRSAILALRQLGDSRAVRPLVALLDDDRKRFEADSTVKEAAYQALVSLGYEPGSFSG